MKRILGIGVLLGLGACAMASNVMEASDGTYLISARAAPVRGGTAGAWDVAYRDAQKFCAAKGQRAVVVDGSERDVYQGSFGGNSSGFGGGYGAQGNVNMRFRCQS